MNEAPEGAPCPVCGTPEDDKNPENFLQFGFILDDRYLLGKAIESNGEGVTYISFDRTTRSVVRVREFFPTGLCTRGSDGSVTPAEGAAETYEACLTKFLQLCKKLYELRETPGLLPVQTIFRMNGTAYCVSEDVPSAGIFNQKRRHTELGAGKKPVFTHYAHLYRSAQRRGNPPRHIARHPACG